VTRGQDARLSDAFTRLREQIDDQVAWADLYASLRPYVFAIAFRHLRGHVTLAEEVTQEVFKSLAEKPPFRQLADVARLRAYVAATSRNLAISCLRRVAPESPLEPDEPGPAELPSFELLLTLEEVFDELEPEDRRLLELVVEGQRLAQIAERLGITYSNAGVKLHRLRRFLGARLKSERPEAGLGRKK
jgi:RNA polymerase sigma factor (sigma-70 family)